MIAYKGAHACIFALSVSHSHHFSPLGYLPALSNVDANVAANVDVTGRHPGTLCSTVCQLTFPSV